MSSCKHKIEMNNNNNNNLKYQLADKLPIHENLVYAAQQVVFFIASAIIMPIMVSYLLGLDQAGVASTIHRTLILCGVVSILQTRFGHHYPIMEGPAGLWSGLFILMANMTISSGGELDLLRTNLELGVIISGLFIFLLVAFNVIDKILSLFNPLINGIVILLMVLQISPSIIKGMAGITDGNVHINAMSALIFFFTMVIIIILNAYAKGFVKGIATLIGVIAGWILAGILGMTQASILTDTSFFSLPVPFSWGAPTFDIGVVITCIIAALVLLSTEFASISGMANAVDEEVPKKNMNRSIGIHGLSSVLAGVFSTIPFMAFYASVGVVKITNVASRQPFYIASVFMIIMGLISPIGLFFATMPTAVGYAAMIIVFAMIWGQGMNELAKVQFGNRESMIMGISMLIGVGIMFLPVTTFENMPSVIGSLFSNGLITGVIVAFLLDHVIFRVAD